MVGSVSWCCRACRSVAGWDAEDCRTDGVGDGIVDNEVERPVITKFGSLDHGLPFDVGDDFTDVVCVSCDLLLPVVPI